MSWKSKAAVDMKTLPWRVIDILQATGGILLGGEAEGYFGGLSIDSRRISANELFIAIKGEHHDGHDFIDEVIAAGVRGVLVEKHRLKEDVVNRQRSRGLICIGVDDTRRALGDLGCFRRRHTAAKVVAITGSNGKTTTKEMTAGILTESFEVLAADGNLNNDIGLPLTLFRLNSLHEWAVLELGMNHPGEIRRLAEICVPDIGVITNVGPSHLEGLGSIEAVARAKGELLENIKSEGIAVLNADDPLVMAMVDQSPVTTCLYGQNNPNAVIRAESITDRGNEASFNLILPSENIFVDLKVPGRHMISNALAAAAVGHLSGLSAERIKAGLEKFIPVKGRMNLHRSPEGINVIDDTYNANPLSTQAAMDALSSLRKGNRSALVLGDMLELGRHARDLHWETGRAAFEHGIERLFLTGDYATDVANGALEAGMDASAVIKGNQTEILESLLSWMKSGDWILVKGSRSMKMEILVNDLLQEHCRKTKAI